jgi:hypothetical protein
MKNDCMLNVEMQTAVNNVLFYYVNGLFSYSGKAQFYNVKSGAKTGFYRDVFDMN